MENGKRRSRRSLSLGSNSIFQQDYDLKPTAKIVKLRLLYNCKMRLHTPPQSTDLNGIENLLSKLEISVQKHNSKNKEYLKAVLQEEWAKIIPQATQTLVNSISCRLEAVLEAKRYATKYSFI
ncbi:hypothetical protein AVEN_257316-1 [Araneus ventricosus]|uniref:Uncharacterized protein n=1 Tax=Araneus ventricosus TaxID=182803 RepID=A0A4Y2NJL2_ARAVE|nr:hypothetical protein AVEN_257316-1 [Araneus ventricosus]